MKTVMQDGFLTAWRAVMVGSLVLSSAFAMAAAEPTATLDHHEDATCVVRNLRGAEYVGRAWGEYDMDRACHYAFEQCWRDSLLPRTCHIVYRGPSRY